VNEEVGRGKKKGAKGENKRRHVDEEGDGEEDGGGAGPGVEVESGAGTGAEVDEAATGTNRKADKGKIGGKNHGKVPASLLKGGMWV
jgi:hypothetical protein